MPKKLTTKEIKNLPSGGVLVGEEEGEIIIHEDASKGGVAVGNYHEDGGIEGNVEITGKQIEFQGNEVIITADAVVDSRKRYFEGRMLTNKEILSEINEGAGGVSFAYGGQVKTKMYDYGGIVAGTEVTLYKKEHEYTGKTIWVLKISGKYDWLTWDRVLTIVRKNGGYWSQHVTGFVFKEEPKLSMFDTPPVLINIEQNKIPAAFLETILKSVITKAKESSLNDFNFWYGDYFILRKENHEIAEDVVTQLGFTEDKPIDISEIYEAARNYQGSLFPITIEEKIKDVVKAYTITNLDNSLRLKMVYDDLIDANIKCELRYGTFELNSITYAYHLYLDLLNGFIIDYNLSLLLGYGEKDLDVYANAVGLGRNYFGETVETIVFNKEEKNEILAAAATNNTKKLFEYGIKNFNSNKIPQPQEITGEIPQSEEEIITDNNEGYYNPSAVENFTPSELMQIIEDDKRIGE